MRFVLSSVCLTLIARSISLGCPDDPEVDLCEVDFVGCPDDPEVDLCDVSPPKKNGLATTKSKDEETNGATRISSAPFMTLILAVAGGLGGRDGSFVAAPLLLSALFSTAEAQTGDAAATSVHQTCGAMKTLYKSQECCKAPTKEMHFQVVPFPKKASSLGLGTNKCAAKNPGHPNIDCVQNSVVKALEQAGADVTKAAKQTGTMVAVGKEAVTVQFSKAPKGLLCPVNVHWHIGAEHRSKGEYDESGKSPKKAGTPATGTQAPKASGRRLGVKEERYGFACHHYDANDVKFTKPYAYQHCKEMNVGETYEIHWPHSALGACNTPHQYQTKFYDGVFCNFDNATHGNLKDLSGYVGVQSQVFTVVNDEAYYYANLMKGMIVGGNFGKDIGIYTGSSTGTSRNNKKCSPYAPITWQVDRKCHLISASSFDKMCADMKQNLDDMSGDLHPHGARLLVAKDLQANNLVDADHVR